MGERAEQGTGVGFDRAAAITDLIGDNLMMLKVAIDLVLRPRLFKPTYVAKSF